MSFPNPETFPVRYYTPLIASNVSTLLLDGWEAKRHFWMYDIVPYLPDYRILYCQVPLVTQAFLLSLPRQTERIRLTRMALIPLGLYYTYKILYYDNLPLNVFRLQNWLKNMIVLLNIQRTLEMGLAKASNRPKWIGFNVEKLSSQEDHASDHVSFLDWRSLIYAISLFSR